MIDWYSSWVGPSILMILCSLWVSAVAVVLCYKFKTHCTGMSIVDRQKRTLVSFRWTSQTEWGTGIIMSFLLFFLILNRIVWCMMRHVIVHTNHAWNQSCANQSCALWCVGRKIEIERSQQPELIFVSEYKLIEKASKNNRLKN